MSTSKKHLEYKPSNDFINVAAACPITNVCDIDFNLKNIEECIQTALNKNVKMIVFPELCITSYTCADLFLNTHLLTSSLKAIENLCDYLKNKDILVAIGSPIIYEDSLYNCAFIIYKGKILGVIPKSYIPNYTEFYEKRWFTSGIDIKDKIINLPFSR